VPVALNHGKISHAKNEGGEFFRRVYAQTINTQYQGLWLITADGQILAISCRELSKPSVWPVKTLEDLQPGMKKFGAITPRRPGPANSLPYRGIGVRPDGSVALAVTDRVINVQDRRRQLQASDFGETTPDHVDLSAADWSALAPPEVSVGNRWTIPEAVGRQFCPMLGHNTYPFQHPKYVTEARFGGRVVSVSNGIAHLVFEGSLAGLMPGSKSLNLEGQRLISTTKIIGGVGSYDIRAGRMLSLTWVCDADFLAYHYPSAHVSPFRYGTVLEWRQGDPKAPPEVKSAEGETQIDLADSTPEGALKTFLLALAAQDETTLRAVTLPHAEFDLLLKSPSTSSDQLALLKTRLDEKPMKRLKEGDPVRMPDGETRVIKPADVREGRVVLWPDGSPLPSRLENVGGHWRVFAAPFIAARK